MGSRRVITENRLLFIVDDCTAYRVLIAILLNREGYTVKSFSNAEMAIEALSIEVPDMIISDLEMPQMNGLDFFRELKKLHNYHQEIPFIIISSIDNEARIKEVRQVSKAPFLRKSTPLTLIIERIKSFIDKPETLSMGNK